jgi:transcriptional regulator CtsR
MTVNEFIKELKPMVYYDKKTKQHMMGSTILTNQELIVMLETMLGDDYISLKSNKRTQIRQRVFKEVTND